MKKFDFPLAKVTTWAGQQLAAEQLVLAQLLRELESVEQQLTTLRQRVTDTQIATQTQAVITGHELDMLSRFVQQLTIEKSHLQRLRGGLTTRVELQRQRVIAGHRKVKLFENLHERRRQEWLLALTKEENDTASDLFLAKFAREQQLADPGV